MKAECKETEFAKWHNETLQEVKIHNKFSGEDVDINLETSEPQKWLQSIDLSRKETNMKKKSKEEDKKQKGLI
jgi:hypothetical protein